MKHLATYILLVCSITLCAAANGPRSKSIRPLTSLSEIKPENLAYETSDDGIKFVAMRMRKAGAPAVRVRITGMHLKPGEKLFIYSPDRSRIYGSFEGGGPVNTGEFWSEAIAGTDVVVEFQAGMHPPGDLPFRVAELKQATLAETAVSKAASPDIETVLFEGDILLAPGEAAQLRKAKPGSKAAVSITGSRYRWPGGVMPYVISPLISNQGRITEAIAHWNTTMAGYVQMVPRTNEGNYVGFYLAPDPGACNSNVGMTGFGGQAINVGNYCSTGNLIHEIGHAWGLWHEHTRADRDTYVTVNWGNIASGQSYNFNQNGSNSEDLAEYDFNSIMHYNATSFSANGQATIETKPAGIPIGQRTGLSTGDIAAIRFLYPYGPPPSVTTAVTVTSNPSGLPIIVDGVSRVTPATFEWEVGSSHTVSASDKTQPGVRHQFAGWSDGGARTHTITASASTTMLKADYSVSYSVDAVARPQISGVVNFTPESSDRFYAASSTIELVARPEPGYCFTGWTGLVAGTPDRTTVTATRAYSVAANFQTGSLSLTLPDVRAFAAGGSYRVGLMASTGCRWFLSPNVPWITITTAASGTGSTSFWFQVEANPSTTPRFGQIRVGDQLLQVTQLGM